MLHVIHLFASSVSPLSRTYLLMQCDLTYNWDSCNVIHAVSKNSSGVCSSWDIHYTCSLLTGTVLLKIESAQPNAIYVALPNCFLSCADAWWHKILWNQACQIWIEPLRNGSCRTPGFYFDLALRAPTQLNCVTYAKWAFLKLSIS